MMAPLGTLFATTTLTWKRIAPCSASRNQTLATKSRKSIECRMWVDISQLCQLCCSQLWPMHVQKDFVQWLVQDFVQWSFWICCSKSFSKKVRAIQLNFSCCHFDSNTSSNSKLRKEKFHASTSIGCSSKSRRIGLRFRDLMHAPKQSSGLQTEI